MRSALEMISLDHAHTHLRDLRITECHKLESLPENMHMLLPSLTKLSILNCPRLESLHGGLPSNLKDLTIIKCSRFVGSLKGALGDTSSLKSLWIEVDVECFPDKRFTSTLSYLSDHLS